MDLFLFFAGALTLTLCGCVTAPDLATNRRVIRSADLGLSSQDSARVAASWWSTFNDPQLDDLMRQAFVDNPSLAQAMVRVREAQSAADVTRAALAPTISYDAQEVRQRPSTVCRDRRYVARTHAFLLV